MNQSDRKAILTPLVIDRSRFPNAADEYTPEQRKQIDTQFDRAEKGPFYGPFKNGNEVAVFLTKKRWVGAKTTRRNRPQ
jgi:hypothetical protein